MAKKKLTPEEIYKHNRKKAKILKALAPICFWGFLALAVVCLVLAIKNSFGNILEIMRLLDSKKYTGETLKHNYEALVQKYGEWTIGNGSAGFQIRFINIGHAVFSGIMAMNCVLFVVFLISAYVLGKWLLPKISAQILINNQDMVNMTVLKNADKDKE